MSFGHFVMLTWLWYFQTTLCYVCPTIPSCTYPFINSDMTIASDAVLMICSLRVAAMKVAPRLVWKSLNNSVAEFISRSGLRLLIWSRRTSPRCWHTCSTRCLEGCTRDSWWWFAAGRQWKASWSRSICSLVSLSWSSSLWEQKKNRRSRTQWELKIKWLVWHIQGSTGIKMAAV